LDQSLTFEQLAESPLPHKDPLLAPRKSSISR
jgi:hypothetical protein